MFWDPPLPLHTFVIEPEHAQHDLGIVTPVFGLKPSSAGPQLLCHSYRGQEMSGKMGT